MKRIVFLVCLSIIMIGVHGQYQTRPLRPNVRTLRATFEGNETAQQFPCLKLGEKEQVTFSFDCLDENIKNYSYHVINCDAEWFPSELSDAEWCAGYAENDITQFEVSRNTHQSYVHYSFSLPNEDCRFRRSGNYAIVVYESGEENNRVATFRLYVTEQSVTVSGKVTGETRKELNGRFQELRFEINASGIEGLTFPTDQLKVFLTQNDRDDLERKVSFMGQMGNKFSYGDRPEFIFEGGREFHTVDFSSRYAYGDGIEQIRFYDPYYHVTLTPVVPSEPSEPYQHRFDTNGRFTIHQQEWDSDDLTSDYFLVHFFLKTPSPLFDEKVYVLGGFNQMRIDESTRMIYNVSLGGYERTILLKQGGYGFLVTSVPRDGGVASTLKTEGSYWQTENEYRVKVYFRAVGERSDRLLSVSVINSR